MHACVSEAHAVAEDQQRLRTARALARSPVCFISSCDLSPLPAESNCTYFKFFTSGENAVIFKKTTQNSEPSHPDARPG